MLLLERDASIKEGWLARLWDGTGGRSVKELFDPPEPFQLSKIHTFSDRRFILEDALAACQKYLSTLIFAGSPFSG